MNKAKKHLVVGLISLTNPLLISNQYIHSCGYHATTYHVCLCVICIYIYNSKSVFQFFEYESYDVVYNNITERALRKTDMRENPYYATYYVFWSKVILMELIPYLFISTLNGFIIAKVFSSYKFRQQFARNSSSRRNSPTNVAQKEPAIDVKGKF